MGLIFGGATSDRIVVTANASIDDLTTFAGLMWHFPTTLTDNRRWWSKGGSGQKSMRWQNSGEIQFGVSRAGGFGNRTGSKVHTADQWWCTGWRYSEADGPEFATGDLNAVLVEDDYGSLNDPGSGATTADNDGTLRIANRGSFTAAYQGTIAIFMIFNTNLTFSQLIQQQFSPHVLPSTVLYMNLGFSGTTTQANWGGGSINNGTITGATFGDHVPLGPLFGAMDLSLDNFEVPASLTSPLTSIGDMAIIRRDGRRMITL